MRVLERYPSNQVVGSSNLSGRANLRASAVGNYGGCGKSLHGSRAGKVAFVDAFGGFRARMAQKGLSFSQSCCIGPGFRPEVVEGKTYPAGRDETPHEALPYR
jgi:hypothetical protein